MKPRRLLGLDPGQTTGVAYALRSEKSLLIYRRYDVMTLREIAALDWHSVDDVIYEGFVNRGPHLKLDGVEVIGVIKFLADQHDHKLYKVGAGNYHWVEGRLPGLLVEKSHYDEAAGHLIFHAFENKIRRFAIRNDIESSEDARKCLFWLDSMPVSRGGEYNHAPYQHTN